MTCSLKYHSPSPPSASTTIANPIAARTRNCAASAPACLSRRWRRAMRSAPAPEAERVQQQEQWPPQQHAQQRRPPETPRHLRLAQREMHGRADDAVVDQQPADRQRLLRQREEAQLGAEALQDEGHHHQSQSLFAEQAAEGEI